MSQDDIVSFDPYRSLVVRIRKVVLADDNVSFFVSRLVSHRDVQISARDGIEDIVIVIEVIALEFKTVIGLAVYFGLIDVQLAVLHDRDASVIVDLYIAVVSAQSEISVIIKEVGVLVESYLSVVVEHVAVSVSRGGDVREVAVVLELLGDYFHCRAVYGRVDLQSFCIDHTLGGLVFHSVLIHQIAYDGIDKILMEV